MPFEGMHVRHELRTVLPHGRAADPARNRDLDARGLALEGSQHERFAL